MKIKINTIKEMKYMEEWVEYSVDYVPEILAKGSYKNIPFVILNINGRHPCCYIQIKNKKINDNEYDQYLDCHGGVTYSRSRGQNNILYYTKNKVWVGWDYAHLDDYNFSINKKGHKWTTAELINEVINTIDSLHD